ncbi:MAG TPA: bifunctional 2-polyprenyl-6-hydroxyphenol methylase/3-demethylubiquinol 3-O-methyltransferase UbiG [Alphaproteobacteria bacterium]|nr:bifunctional 2-polyprenyl-6-hydroxyphenol methylase/3-demethylubiquinol 3-O-methyltransferase UbiG [Alphaproteobacteria bacterium]
MARQQAASIEAEEIAQFARHAGDWWNPNGSFRPLHRLNPVRLEYVRDQVCAHFGREPNRRNPLEGLSVLDVGCGGGLLTEPLARMGAKTEGLDAAEEAIQTAKQHAKASKLSITYHADSVENLARGKNRYDLITALEIVEHVADMNSFLGALKKLLKPDGILIMSTLNRTPKSFLLGIVAAEYILNWVPRGTHQHKKFVKPSELVQRLEEMDLRTTDLTGLIYNPLRREFELRSDDLNVNYMLTAMHD